MDSVEIQVENRLQYICGHLFSTLLVVVLVYLSDRHSRIIQEPSWPEIVIPKNSEIQTRIINRISDLTWSCCCHYFVYTGLRTQAGILIQGNIVDQLCLYSFCARCR
jgi:hypothetical protein